MYEIYFSESEEGRIDDIGLYESRLDSIIEALGASGDFSITFVSDEEIRKLNSQYREKDEPTDVLTFRLKEHNEKSDAILETMRLALLDVTKGYPRYIRMED